MMWLEFFFCSMAAIERLSESLSVVSSRRFPNANHRTNTRLTVTEDGLYQVSAMVTWSANPTSSRVLAVRKNGSLAQLGDICIGITNVTA
jgi:hypothetical protein